MVYGYVNLENGENESFLDEFKSSVDKIICHTGDGFDFSFAESGDTVVIYELKSVCEDLKGLLEFSQFIFQNQIEIRCIDSESKEGNAFIDTQTAIGKMIINILSALNEFDNKYFLNN